MFDNERLSRRWSRPIDLVMSSGTRQIGTVNKKLRGNNCDGLDLALLLTDNPQTFETVTKPSSSPAVIPSEQTPLPPEQLLPMQSLPEQSMLIQSLPTSLGQMQPVRRTRELITREMLWSHHWADQHDRCAHVGGKLICRRCLVLYPVTILVLALSQFGVGWPGSLDTVLLFFLPLPLVLDFVFEHMGLTRYSPRRQMATTLLGATALGHAFSRYLAQNADPLFWTMTAGYAGLCAGALAVHHLRDQRSAQAQAAHSEASDPLVNGFATREEMLAYFAE
jgi:hypothetical protein